MRATVATVAGKRYKIEFGEMPYTAVREIKTRLEALAASPQLSTELASPPKDRREAPIAR